MSVFKIKIVEELCKEIEIEAKNIDEAIYLTKKSYYKEEIILDSENFNSVEFEISD